MSEHPRFDLDDAVREGQRQAIDADWSARKKSIVGVCAAVVAAASIGGGAWAYLNTRTPSLPRTMDEALTVMSSGKLDRMAPDRRGQYAEEARRILWSLTDEERRKLFEDEKNREALRALREQAFDDMAYRVARGEQIDWSEYGPPRREMSDEDRQRWREQMERMQNMTPEERQKAMAQRMEEMRNRMADQMRQQLANGNAQSGALRGEMMGRGRGGAGGPRGPGGPGGGGRGGNRGPR